jgi:hypothetical protein
MECVIRIPTERTVRLKVGKQMQFFGALDELRQMAQSYGFDGRSCRWAGCGWSLPQTLLLLWINQDDVTQAQPVRLE